MTNDNGGAPTTATKPLNGQRWVDRRVFAWTVRAVALGGPVFGAIIAVRLFIELLALPEVLLAQVGFWLAALGLSVVVGIGTSRWTGRLDLLASLLRTTLVFPDEAPNRLRLVLRRQPSEPITSAQNLIVLVTRLDHHDRATGGHAFRVRAYANLIGTEMGLPDDEIDKLKWGALLHDIGKLSVPAGILNQDAAPDDGSWQILRNHPVAATAYLGGTAGWLGDWAMAALEHHEHWDGSGYPGGLTREHISLAGRIVAVADAYDIMTSPRSYKPALSASHAREDLARHAGSQFDPTVVRALLAVPVGRLRRIIGVHGWLNELTLLARVPMPSAKLLATATAAAMVGIATVATGSTAPPIEEQAAAERVVETDPSNTAVSPATTSPTTTASPTTTTTTTTTTIPSTTTTPSTAPPVADSDEALETASVAGVAALAEPALADPVSPTTPTGSGFVITDAAALPRELDEGQLTADGQVFVWPEGARTTEVDTPIRAYADGVGFDGSHDPELVVPAGSTVCTYFLHHDPVTPAAGLEVVLDFGVAPLGFALRGADLDATSRFATADVDHHSDGLSVADSLIVEGSAITLRLDGVWGRDQMRIFFSC